MYALLQISFSNIAPDPMYTCDPSPTPRNGLSKLTPIYQTGKTASSIIWSKIEIHLSIIFSVLKTAWTTYSLH